MNKSRRDDGDAPGSQSQDQLDNFWIDLNEATAMRPIAKAQIYSIKQKNSPANQVAQMWDVLDQLERTRRKDKRKGEVAEKVQREL